MCLLVTIKCETDAVGLLFKKPCHMTTTSDQYINIWLLNVQYFFDNQLIDEINKMNQSFKWQNGLPNQKSLISWFTDQVMDQLNDIIISQRMNWFGSLSVGQFVNHSGYLSVVFAGQ